MNDKTDGTKISATEAIAAVGRVDAALGSGPPEAVLNDVLGTVLDEFSCDRAYLAMPCDPEAESFRIQMIATRPPWDDGHPPGTVLPVGPVQREVFLMRLERDGPLCIDIERLYTEEFSRLRALGGAPDVMASIKATMSIAINPPVGPIWGFGIQHCSEMHVFTAEEKSLFELIARRVSDTLSLWAIEDRLADVSSLEVLGLMLADTAKDLTSLVDKIEAGLVASSGEDIAGLRKDTQLMRRMLNQIGGLAPQKAE